MITPIQIGNRLVGPGHKPYIVAEAAINHQGEYPIAERMVHMAHALGVDAIKFQIHVLSNEMLREAPQSDNFEEPLYDTLDKTNLTVEEHIKLKALCNTLGIHYICTPFSRDGTDILEKEIGVDVYKVGSGELTNLPLQEHIARKGKPTVVSTGMSTVEEIAETVAVYRDIGTPFMLTHCISAYPAPYHIVNLKLIPKYEDMFEVPVGLSDHSRGIYTSLGAVAVGASLIEKHFTLDKLQKGPDHASSLEPFELGELVKGAEAIFLALGDDKRIFPEEEQIVAWAREAVVAEKLITKGSTITDDMVWVKRPSPGPGAIPAKDLKKVIGRVAQVDIPADVQLKWEYLE